MQGAGAIATVIRIYTSWPPPLTTRIAEVAPSPERLCDYIVRLDVHADGHLSLSVRHPDRSPLISAEFQKVQVRGFGNLFLIANWTTHSASLDINDLELGPYHGDGEPIIIEISPPPGLPGSLDHPESIRVCSDWMQKRAQKFASSKVRSGRRQKSDEEQARELADAIENLRSLVADIRNEHELNLLGHLAAELRALLYWKQDDQADWSYNPLILRMASKASLPLPVYAIRGSHRPLPPVHQNASLHIEGFAAGLHRTAPGQELMDVQAWLDERVVTLRVRPPEVEEVVYHFSIRERVLETATTMGGGHYDPDVSLGISALRGQILIDIDAVSRVLCAVGTLTAELGDYVLSQLGGTSPESS
jgi:hypothetical protein